VKLLGNQKFKEVALEIALNLKYHPIMVMCASGIHQTGTLVGCLRRLQHWNLTSILVEYRSYACHRSTRYGDEQFIELFDVDLVTLPAALPQWFIEQTTMAEEEDEEERRKEEVSRLSNTTFKQTNLAAKTLVSLKPAASNSNANTL